MTTCLKCLFQSKTISDIMIIEKVVSEALSIIMLHASSEYHIVFHTTENTTDVAFLCCRDTLQF